MEQGTYIFDEDNYTLYLRDSITPITFNRFNQNILQKADVLSWGSQGCIVRTYFESKNIVIRRIEKPIDLNDLKPHTFSNMINK